MLPPTEQLTPFDMLLLLLQVLAGQTAAALMYSPALTNTAIDAPRCPAAAVAAAAAVTFCLAQVLAGQTAAALTCSPALTNRATDAPRCPAAAAAAAVAGCWRARLQQP
jgi:hypothetical protein